MSARTLTLHVEQLWDSPWVFHAFVALEEKRLSYTVQVETLPFSDERRAALQEHALLCKVPILEHGDVFLTESLAISEYLAENFPYPAHPRIFPSDLADRGRARQLMNFLRTDLFALRKERPTSSVFIAPVDAPLGDAARRDADELLRVAGRLLEPGRTSLFAEWCIADADLALALMRLIANGDPVPEPLFVYAAAQWARPSVRAFVARGRDPRTSDSLFWDERFRSEDYVYGTEPNDFLAEWAHRIPAGGRVLSLAEGEGRNGTFLAARGHRVTSVDFSREGLRKAARLARERGVTLELVEADLTTYEPEPSAYDGAVWIFCHLPPEARRRLCRQVARALKPGGVFLFEGYTPRQLAFDTGGPKELELLIEPQALREDLSGLDLERLVEAERDVFEGPVHGGRSATVQAVAVKR